MTQTATIDWYDEVKPVWEQGVDVRSTFVLRTYGHLMGAILAFVGIEVALFTSGVAERIAEPMLGNWLLVLGGFILVGWFGSKVAHTSASRTAQYLALGAYVLVEALIFCPLLLIAEAFAPGVIGDAAMITVAGFSGLTAIAFVTRKDFSFLRGVLLWGGMIALALIVLSVFGVFQLGIVFAIAMIALAGASILYDTSNVLHHYPPDRYVGASLSLFASVALLFWYVIYLLMLLRD